MDEVAGRATDGAPSVIASRPPDRVTGGNQSAPLGPAERELRTLYGPGPSGEWRLYLFVYGRVRQICARRPPAVAGHAYWDKDAWADVTHEVFARYLIGGGQLEYAFTHATSEEHFYHLIDKQIRHTLDAIGPSSLASNVADRCVKVLMRDPQYEHIELAKRPGRLRRYRLRGVDAPLGMSTDADLLAAVTATRAIPRTALAGPGARVHTYAASELAQFVETVAHFLPMSFARADVKWIAQRIFEAAGEALIVEWPGQGREGREDDANDSVDDIQDWDPGPADTYEAMEAAQRIRRRLSRRQLRILAGRSAGMSNAELARRLGCRPKDVVLDLVLARKVVDQVLESEHAIASVQVICRDLVDLEMRQWVWSLEEEPSSSRTAAHLSHL